MTWSMTRALFPAEGALRRRLGELERSDVDLTRRGRRVFPAPSSRIRTFSFARMRERPTRPEWTSRAAGALPGLGSR